MAALPKATTTTKVGTSAHGANPTVQTEVYYLVLQHGTIRHYQRNERKVRAIPYKKVPVGEVGMYKYIT
jgi:hypothetical protein